MSLIGTCMVFFFSSRRRHTIFDCDWSSDVCSSDLYKVQGKGKEAAAGLLADARALEEAGAFAVVLEAIPMDVARKIGRASCRERVLLSVVAGLTKPHFLARLPLIPQNSLSICFRVI